MTFFLQRCGFHSDAPYLNNVPVIVSRYINVPKNNNCIQIWWLFFFLCHPQSAPWNQNSGDSSCHTHKSKLEKVKVSCRRRKHLKGKENEISSLTARRGEKIKLLCSLVWWRAADTSVIFFPDGWTGCGWIYTHSTFGARAGSRHSSTISTLPPPPRCSLWTPLECVKECFPFV